MGRGAANQQRTLEGIKEEAHCEVVGINGSAHTIRDSKDQGHLAVLPRYEHWDPLSVIYVSARTPVRSKSGETRRVDSIELRFSRRTIDPIRSGGHTNV